MFRAIAHWFLTHGLMIMFAAGGATLPTAGGGGGGSSSSGGDGTGGTPPPATGAPGGSPTSSSATSTGTPPPPTPGQGQGSVDWATAPAHFRTAYEQAQQELQRWKGLGVDHTAAQSYVQTAQGMVNESYKIGRELGYSDQDIREALQDDVVNTLTFLRRAAVQANGQGRGGQPQNGRQPNQNDQFKSMLDQRLRPIEEHTNAALADAANSAFRGEFDRLVADHYKADAANLPKEVRELLYDATSEMFKYEDKALHALKFGRDVSGIAKTFREVEQRVMQAFNAYHMWQLSKSGQAGGAGRPGAQAGAGSQAQGGQDEGFSLDDVIEGNERATKRLPSMRINVS